MRILFISTNRNKSVMPPMPLGLASVIAQIDASKHFLRVVDLMFSTNPEQELMSVLSDFNPEVIAVSIRNLDNQNSIDTVFFLPEDKKYVTLCREKTNAVIVVGGPAFTVSPKAVFNYLEPDFGIAGEGEIVFKHLIDCIENKQDWKHLPGLVWQESGIIHVNPMAHIQDMDALKIPRRELFDNKKYSAATRGLGNIVVKQGCTFRCLYCDSPHVLGPKWRKKSPENVVKELEVMKNENGIKIAYFTDAIFNYPQSYAESICREIIKKGLRMPWVATLHPAFADRDFVSLMQKAGCVVLSVSCDTCSEKMLKALKKDITKEELSKTTLLLEDMKIPYMLSLLMGGPGEDRATVEESIDFLRQRNPMSVNFCAGIRLMPHSELFSIAVKEGIIQENDPLMEPKFYLSPHIKDWIKDYLDDVCTDNKTWNFSHGTEPL